MRASNLLIILPRYYGNTGDAINERQLSFYLSKFFKSIYIITLIRCDEVLRNIHKSYYSSANTRIIEIVRPPYPSFLHLPIMLAYGFFIKFILVFLNLNWRVSYMYIRDPVLAAPFLNFKNSNIRIMIKVHRLQEDELTIVSCPNFLRKLFLKIGSLIQHYVILKADFIASPSKAFGNILIEKYQCSPNKIIIIPAGFSDALIKKIKKKKINIKPIDMRIGYIGSLDDLQGLDILIKSMKYVQAKYPNAILYIIGAGVKYNYYKQMAAKIGIKYVFKGPLPHSKALLEMRNLFCLVVPSRPLTQSIQYTPPIKVIEALALGIPVIFTQYLPLKNIFGNSLIYVDNNISSISNAIINLIEHSNDLRSNRPLFLKEFSYRTLAKKIFLAFTKN